MKIRDFDFFSRPRFRVVCNQRGNSTKTGLERNHAVQEQLVACTYYDDHASPVQRVPANLPSPVEI